MTKPTSTSKKPRKQHTPEFRDETLKLAERIGVSAARQLSLYESQLYCKHTCFSSTHFLRFPCFWSSACTLPASGYLGIHVMAGSVLGLTIKGMAANAAIGVGVNAGVQLAGKDPFSYVDAIMAGTTAALTTGKGIIVSTPINMGGAAVGSSIKGEDPTNSVIGAGLGSVAGGIGGKAVDVLSPISNQVTKDVVGAVTGSAASELTDTAVKNELDERDKK